MNVKMRVSFSRLLRALLIAVILMLAIACVLPLVIIVSGSFMDSSEIAHTFYFSKGIIKLLPKRPTIDQYRQVFLSNGAYLQSLINSLIFALSITILQIAVALPTAYVFEKYHFKGKNFLYGIYLFLMLIPTQVMQLPHYILMNEANMIGTQLSVIIPNAFSALGVVVLRQGMRYCDNAVLDAAKVDGCSELRILPEIVIPCIAPYFLACVVMIFVDTWNMVEYPLIFLSEMEKMPLTVYFSAMNNRQGAVFAMGVVCLAFPVLMSLLLFDVLRDSLSFGEIK